VDLHQEATLRPRVRGERGVVGDGYGESEAVMVVDAVPVDSLEGLEGAVDLLGQDHRPDVPASESPSDPQRTVPNHPERASRSAALRAS
jgi:hypothetical protein